MNADIAALAAQALYLSFRIAFPVVMASAGVGVLVSLLQAVTHIQDQALPFLLKLAAAVLALALTGYWMFGELDRFTRLTFDLIGNTGMGAH